MDTARHIYKKLLNRKMAMANWIKSTYSRATRVSRCTGRRRGGNFLTRTRIINILLCNLSEIQKCPSPPRLVMTFADTISPNYLQNHLHTLSDPCDFFRIFYRALSRRSKKWRAVWHLSSGVGYSAIHKSF